MPRGFFSLGPGDDAVFRDGDVIGLELREVLVEDHRDGQRVTLNFGGSSGANDSDRIELWASRVEQAGVPGSGVEVPLDGQLLLQVDVPGASPVFNGPSRSQVFLPPGGLVEDVALVGAFTGFEGGGALYLGLSSTDVEYCLSSSVDPSRVAIDLRFDDLKYKTSRAAGGQDSGTRQRQADLIEDSRANACQVPDEGA